MITRAELVKAYKVAKTKVENLENKKYEYKTNTAVEPFGKVNSMSIADVVKAGAAIHDGDKNLNDRIAAYGVRPEDLKSDERKYNGFTLDDWDADFKLRVEQIHDKTDLEKYKTVVEKLSKNFTDEDRFLIEMGEIDDLGVDLTEEVETKA